MIGILSILFVILFFDQPFMLAFVLVVLSGVLLYVERSMRLVKLYVAVALLAIIGEFVCVYYFGIWTFTHPQWFGLPVWLPFAYGTISVFIVKVWERLN